MKLNNCLKNSKCKIVVLLIITAFMLPSFGLIINVVAEEQTYQNITIDTANYMIEHENKYPNLVILDVRDTIEYNLGHLYDSILIPINNLEARIGELEDYKTSEIIIYCKSGYRSQQGSEILGEYGFTKVYNMIGGILAWIDADYPIWTISHHITVDEITDEKFELQIEPFLLHYKGCSSCNENQECPIESESVSITSEVLEQGENYTKTIMYYDFNGTVYEFIHTRTILWSYDKFTSNYNKSAYFISSEIASENGYWQYYQLEYVIYHKNYNLTIYTYLEPLNSETYNSSFTSVIYTPTNRKVINSMEFVQFNMSVILSQQYDILAKVTEEMAKIYKNSDDQDIMELYYGYTNMGEGIKSLSELVKEQLGEYNFQIPESYATLMDMLVPNGGNPPLPPPPPPEPEPEPEPVGCFYGDPYWDCVLCQVICAVSSVLICAALIWWVPPAGVYCVYLLALYFSTGSTYITCKIFGCCP